MVMRRLSTRTAEHSTVVPIQAHHPTIVAAADLANQAIGHAHRPTIVAAADLADQAIGHAHLVAEAVVALVRRLLVAEAAVGHVGRALVADAAVALVGRALVCRRLLVRGLVILNEAVVVLKGAPAAMIRLIIARHPLLCQLQGFQMVSRIPLNL